MSYRGRYFQGDFIDLLVVTTDQNQVPQVPDRAPVVEVWSGTTKIATLTLPVIDRYQQAGIFQGQLFLGPAYPAGSYRLVYLWTTGGVAYHGVQDDGFEIVPGGNSNGSIIAMYFYRRPQADYIVQELDSRKLIQKRNPTV